jgi:hypothetical protein
LIFLTLDGTTMRSEKLNDSDPFKNPKLVAQNTQSAWLLTGLALEHPNAAKSRRWRYGGSTATTTNDRAWRQTA